MSEPATPNPSDPSPATATNSPPPAAPATPAAVPTAPAAEQRPGWLPEKFGKPEDLAKSYVELEKLVSKRSQDLDVEDYKRLAEARLAAARPEIEEQLKAQLRKGVPEKPDGYQLTLSEEAVKEWNGDRDLGAVLKDDPAVAWFQTYAHNQGLNQAQFEQGVAGFLGAWEQYHSQNFAAEKAALGDNAEARMETVKLALTAQLGDSAAGLADVLSTAASFHAVEKLLAKATGRTTPADDLPGRQPTGLSKEEIQAKMKDERYWHPTKKDPAFINEITAAWQKLYPGKVQIG
jgi:hypothetical protein